MTMKKKILTTLSVVLILGLAALGILAYLMDDDSDVNVMTLGNVDIDQHEYDADGKEVTNGDFGDLYPGMEVVKKVEVENIGDSDCYFRTLIAFEDIDSETFEIDFPINEDYKWSWGAPEATIEIDGVTYQVYEAVYNKALASGTTSTPSLTKVELSKESTNEDMDALGGTYEILVLSQAVQTAGFADAASALDEAFGDVDVEKATAWFKEVLNKHAADVWDGTADTSWYNDKDTEFVITTAEQLAGLADLVDGGNTFAGKTIKLGKNIDLYAEDEKGERISFDPIGYGYNTVFKGTFDGQGHTIDNLYQNGWALGLDYSTEGGGLFASVVDATIKNLTIDNAEIVMECIDMGTLVGYSYGNCTYENITISNSTIANYNRYTGGVIGEVNGTQTFKNVDVIDTTVSALWGTYDASLGGIIGGKWGTADITFEDCDVACVLDAFNDACANYQYYNYRLCGMLIGMSEEVTDGTATASYLTAKNCTVTYGDWANYTYCEFEANGKGSYSAPDEWKFSRVQEGYATEGVDPNHTHDTDESHEEMMVFDQLFGGDKGVKGGKTHTGVTVIYN